MQMMVVFVNGVCHLDANAAQNTVDISTNMLMSRLSLHNME